MSEVQREANRRRQMRDSGHDGVADFLDWSRRNADNSEDIREMRRMFPGLPSADEYDMDKAMGDGAVSLNGMTETYQKSQAYQDQGEPAEGEERAEAPAFEFLPDDYYIDRTPNFTEYELTTGHSQVKSAWLRTPLMGVKDAVGGFLEGQKSALAAGGGQGFGRANIARTAVEALHPEAATEIRNANITMRSYYEEMDNPMGQTLGGMRKDEGRGGFGGFAEYALSEMAEFATYMFAFRGLPVGTGGKLFSANMGLMRKTQALLVRGLKEGIEPRVLAAELAYGFNPTNDDPMSVAASIALAESAGIEGEALEWLKENQDHPSARVIGNVIDGFLFMSALRTMGHGVIGPAYQRTAQFVKSKLDGMRMELQTLQAALPTSMASPVKPEPGHSLDIDAGERTVSGRTRSLGEGEAASVQGAVAKALEAEAIDKPDLGTDLKLSDARTKELTGEVTDQAREYIRRHPAKDGWRQPELAKVSRNKKGGWNLEWKKENYSFARGADGKLLSKEDRVKRKTKLVSKTVAAVRDVMDRAKAGDKNAAVIMRQAKWYKNMVARLREEYGGMADTFADLLGATSPNTAVPQNWRAAAEALHMFSKGHYRKEVAEYMEYLDAGGRGKDYPDDKLVRKANGKLYGMNSRNVMVAMYDLWRQIEPGTAPKARNFSGNLIGTSTRPTVDVWASRFLDRMSGARKLASASEKGLPGKMGKTGKIGADYGFGDEVLMDAAKELGMDADDLQAVAWFMEKELWANNKWTNKTGAGGSFEEQADLNPTQRTTVGLAVGQPDAPPTPEVVASVSKGFDEVLRDDEGVRAFKVKPTIGQYMSDQEQSLDIEVAATPEWDPAPLVSEVAKQAKAAGQDSAFVSKTLVDRKASANARPGAEVYFKEKTSPADVQDMLDMLRGEGVDGFTFSVDMRDLDGEQVVVGLRYQYVPEFDVMYGDLKPEGVEAKINELQKKLAILTSTLGGDDRVSHATMTWHDTVVMTGDSYDGYIKAADNRGADAGAAGRTDQGAWFGQSTSEAVARATGSDAKPPGGGDNVQGGPDPAEVTPPDGPEPGGSD